MKILIVDDNAEMREMMRSFLPGSFDEIHECDDASDALDRYRTFIPAWVLIDWETGLMAARRILSEFPSAKILFITQYDDPELRSAARDAGAKGLVLKDDLSELRSVLQG